MIVATSISTVTAYASSPPPDPGGGTDCRGGATEVGTFGNTITFKGYEVNCDNASGFDLQILYGISDGGPTHYSNVKTCRGPLAGDSRDNEIKCGRDGITKTLNDSKPGMQ